MLETDKKHQQKGEKKSCTFNKQVFSGRTFEGGKVKAVTTGVLRLFQHTELEHTPILGGGFKYFLFSSLLGEMIQFD